MIIKNLISVQNFPAKKALGPGGSSSEFYQTSRRSAQRCTDSSGQNSSFYTCLFAGSVWNSKFPGDFMSNSISILAISFLYLWLELFPRPTPSLCVGALTPNKTVAGDGDFCCCLVTQLCLTLCIPMNCSTPCFPLHHHLLELAQTQVH